MKPPLPQNLLAGAAIFLMFACDLIQPSKADAFASIRTGETTPAEALALMGEPDTRTAKELLGVQVQVWRYTDRKHVYVLTIGGSKFMGAEPRVLIAEIYPRAEDTPN